MFLKFNQINFFFFYLQFIFIYFSNLNFINHLMVVSVGLISWLNIGYFIMAINSKPDQQPNLTTKQNLTTNQTNLKINPTCQLIKPGHQRNLKTKQPNLDTSQTSNQSNPETKTNLKTNQT